MKAIFFKQNERAGWVALNSATGSLEFASDVQPQLKTALEAVAAQVPLVFVATHTKRKQTDVIPVVSNTQPLKLLEVLVTEMALLGYEGNIIDESVDEQLVALIECLPTNHEVRRQTEINMDGMSILEKTALIEILQEQFSALSDHK